MRGKQVHPLQFLAMAVMVIAACLAMCQASNACDGVAALQLNTGCHAQALTQQVIVPQQYAVVQQVVTPHVQAIVQPIKVRQHTASVPRRLVQRVVVPRARVEVQRQRIVVKSHH